MSLSARLLQVLRANLGALAGEDRETTLEDPIDDDELLGRRPPAPSWAQRRRSAPHLDPRLVQHYHTLQVPVGSDLAVVKQSFRRLLREVHPDLRGDADPEAQERARELIRAYNELCRLLG